MNILITGGTGFIGQYLVDDLLKDDHQVVVLTRREKKSKNANLAYRQWDGRKLPPGIGMYDVIINLAGASLADSRWSDEYKEVILNSRVDATRACVDYINKASRPPKVFLSGSAVGYYGGDNPEVVSEEDAPAEDFLGQTCQLWEAEAEKAQCRTVLLRTGVVLGTDGGIMEKMIPAYKFFLGGTFGNGRQGLPWIHMEDEIRAIRFLMENEACTGPYNLVGPELVDQKTFSETLAKVLHRPDFWWVPKAFLEMILGDQAILVWGGQKVQPRRLKEAGFNFSFRELKPALADLL